MMMSSPSKNLVMRFIVDLEKRAEKTAGPLSYEINRGDVVADVPAKLRHLNMLGMNCVSIQSGAIEKARDQPGVIRTWQVKHIEAHRETLNFRNDRLQTIEQCDMFCSGLVIDISAIFPNDNMC